MPFDVRTATAIWMTGVFLGEGAAKGWEGFCLQKDNNISATKNNSFNVQSMYDFFLTYNAIIWCSDCM